MFFQAPGASQQVGPRPAPGDASPAPSSPLPGPKGLKIGSAWRPGPRWAAQEPTEAAGVPAAPPPLPGVPTSTRPGRHPAIPQGAPGGARLTPPPRSAPPPGTAGAGAGAGAGRAHGSGLGLRRGPLCPPPPTPRPGAAGSRDAGSSTLRAASSNFAAVPVPRGTPRAGGGSRGSAPASAGRRVPVMVQSGAAAAAAAGLGVGAAGAGRGARPARRRGGSRASARSALIAAVTWPRTLPAAGRILQLRGLGGQRLAGCGTRVPRAPLLRAGLPTQIPGAPDPSPAEHPPRTDRLLVPPKLGVETGQRGAEGGVDSQRS